MTKYPVGTRMMFCKPVGDGGYSLDSYDRFNGKIVTLTEALVPKHADTIGHGILADGNAIVFYARWVKLARLTGFGNWIRTKGK